MLKILKRFFYFDTRKRGRYIAFIVSVFASALLGSIIPYFYKLLVDSLQVGIFEAILGVLMAYILVRLAGLVANMASYVLGDYVIFSSSVDARTTVFKRIQELDFAFHSKKSTGSLISAIKRGDGAFFSMHHNLHYNLFKTVVAFGVMIYFFSALDPRFIVLVFVSFIANAIITRFIVKYSVSARTRYNEEEDNISAIIVDNIINYETVKLFAKENWELSRLKSAFGPWKKYLWQYGNSFRAIDASVGSLVNISIFVVLFIALKLYTEAQVSLGDFVLVLGFVSSIFPQFFDIVYGFREMAKNFTDLEKYFSILDERVKIVDPRNPVTLESPNGEVVFDKVSFTYGERKSRAIKNFSLKIRSGQSIALVGRSGSGKTTFAKLLMRFFDPQKGSISIDGVNVKDFSKQYLRSLMGTVPQEPILFNNTLAYNIGYAREGASRKEVVAASKLAHIHNFIESLPKGYETQVGERGIKLSGGQKQRVAIARMILADPSIIVFDEATSHLDSESERLIQEAFWKAAKDKTTIVIAHRLSTVMKADKIVVMDHGRIVEVGTHMDLMAKDSSLYKRFWELQKAS